jgi:precorrin-6x reductase
VRVIREALLGGDGSWTSVADASEAARLLAGTEGNILLTTGSKDLAAFTELIPGFAERLYVRVLPVVSSLERTHELGIPTSHVIAMQGPFSEQMNRVLIDELDIAHLVTKESGTAGGFDEKVRAAQACGIDLVVIERPEDEPGLLLSEAQQLLEDRYGL